jgi:hypothetical protein
MGVYVYCIGGSYSTTEVDKLLPVGKGHAPGTSLISSSMYSERTVGFIRPVVAQASTFGGRVRTGIITFIIPNKNVSYRIYSDSTITLHLLG